MIRLLSARVHWHSALLAQQAQMMSPPCKAKETWIAQDPMHPQHSMCELPHMYLFLPQTECISHEPYIIWFSFMAHMFKMIISPGIYFFFFFFFHFNKILICQVVSWLKGQKMAQNDKKLYLLHYISQEPCIIWLLFMLHMCVRIISPGFFYIISKF